MQPTLGVSMSVLRRRAVMATLVSVVGAATLWSTSAPAQAQGRELPDFADLADKWSPSVVNIRTLERSRAASVGEVDPNVEEFFRRFGIPMPGRPDPRRGPRGDNEEPQQRGVGSGFILSPDGL